MRGSVIVQPVRSVSEHRFSPLPGARAWLFLLAALLASLLIGAPSASATVVAPESPVAADGASKRAPAISGDLAVWADDRGLGGGDIYIRDLSPGGGETQVTNDLATQANPSISGSFVVWQDNSSGNWDIYGLDLSTLSSGGQPFEIAAGAGDQRNPDISGDFVVWEDDSGGDWDVRGRTLPSGVVSDIATGAGDQRSPAVSGERVVWQQISSAGEADIIFKDLFSGAQKQLNTSGGWRQAPDISGDTVVWRDERTAGDLDIYAYDLAGGGERRLTEGAGDQWAPEVSGRVVVWADDRGVGSTDIYGEDISNGDEFAVSTASGPQDDPAVDGDRVVWTSQRDGVDLGVYDIYGTTLDLAPAPPSGLKAVGSAGGVNLSWDVSPEVDLAGYNVYRSGSPDGTYTKLNANLLSAPSYMDSDAPKGTRSYYRFTAVDSAGGESGAGRADAVAPKPTEITLSSSVSTLTYNGGTTNLSGKLASGTDALAGRTVVLEMRPEDATSWSPVPNGRVTTGVDGSFSLTGVRVDKSTDYRALFVSEEDELQSSTSSQMHVNVNMIISVSTSAKYVKVKKFVTIYGMVLPAHTGNVQLIIKHNGAVVSRKFTLLNSSRFSTRYRPLAPGIYYVTALFGSQPNQGVTNTARFVVKR
ncbi:MAG TPA: hypothetical protein VFJ72_09015 [Rubrobacteraceae bacterium]|nr:hypothetical protein [Rubrobacteraceae bacterium]